jgi:hypothetical protein
VQGLAAEAKRRAEEQRRAAALAEKGDVKLMLSVVHKSDEMRP